ncbi:hypothetical protein ABG795_19220 [Enterobacter soli]|nr:hypothetical protein [Enterobacter hormaechei]MED5724290.1 hypothetical protein [Enterobacter hormaechei]
MCWFAVAYFSFYAIGAVIFFGFATANEKKRIAKGVTDDDLASPLDFIVAFVFAAVWPAPLAVAILWWLASRWVRWVNCRG